MRAAGRWRQRGARKRLEKLTETINDLARVVAGMKVIQSEIKSPL